MSKGGQLEVMEVAATTDCVHPDTPPPSPAPRFEDVFRLEYAFVWRTLRHMGVHEAQVNDATQDVFLVVHRRLPDFDASRPLRSWLWGIARRVARDQLRGAFRHQRRLSVVETPTPDSGPEEVLAKQQAVALVDLCLAKLKPKHREVFVLSALEEMPSPEIATALGIPLNTVYSRLRSARNAFAQAVSRHRAVAPEASPTHG